MLTTQQDQLSLGTSHITWYMGAGPCLATDFYFPTIRGMRKHQYVDHYVTKLWEWLWEAFKGAQV